ncbi:MAG: MFS transporter [Chloroflexi bacterium]|nr:MFS transporter [Chloroflexota bacterium]
MTGTGKTTREAQAADGRAGRREWIGLAVLMLPTLLIAMDLTVLHLAVPALTADLKPTSSQLLWITDIYGFMIAGSLITMGTLGDRIGRRRLLLLGATAFGFASVLAAFSTSATMLIAARALLGIAGATLMPSTMSLIRNMFLDAEQRTVAIGIWVSGFSVGSAVGPLVGGILLESFAWGSVFLLGVPVMVVLLIVGRRLLPEFRDPNPGRFDLLSAGMSLAAVLLIIVGIKQFAESGLTALAAISLIAGLTVGVLFVRRQTILTDPLIDLRLFHVPEFSAALATYTLGIFFGFGIFLFVAQYLQLVLGLSPLEAGLWSVPGSVMFIVGSNLSPRVVRRFPPASVVAGGLVLATVGMALLTLIQTDSLALVVIGNAIMSFGFGFTFTLTVDMVVSAAPPERAGAASALSETGAELGGALGLAVLGSLGMAIYRAEVAANLPTGVSAGLLETIQGTLGGAVEAAGQLPGALGAQVLDAAHQAFVRGMQLNALIGVVGFVGLVVLTATLLRHVRPHGEQSEETEPSPVLPQRGVQAGD